MHWVIEGLIGGGQDDVPAKPDMRHYDAGGETRHDIKN